MARVLCANVVFMLPKNITQRAEGHAHNKTPERRRLSEAGGSN